MGLAMEHEDQDGFTLIELMVVVLVLAVLLAVAIPAFLGSRQRAQDAAARSHLDAAYRSSLGLQNGATTTDGSGSFAVATPAELRPELPGLTVGLSPSNGAREVSVASPMGAAFGSAIRSASGTCFALSAVNGAVVVTSIPESQSLRCDGNTAAWWAAAVPAPVAPGTVLVGPNGHGYEFVAGAVSNAGAVAGAAARTWNGLTGHLMTITDPDEQLMAKRLAGPTEAWHSGSDQAVEGTWRHQAGPEAGQSFWLGGPNGSSVGDAFTAWPAAEPNNWANDDCLFFSWSGRPDGRWNDVPCSAVAPYLVEYEP
jgi:prepilin-type N-terminal cleavage/methylation domain-containing protein